MIEIDGSRGEGGGQILRTSLTLSILTGTPFRMTRVRARRPRPGLLRQHLAALRAAAQISGASFSGAELGSSTIEFTPATVTPGNYHFTIGSAGSTTLVLQTLLLPLALAGGRSTVTIEGGTHNLKAPTFDFLEATYLPLMRRMGVKAEARLDRAGFYPAGGGLVVVTIDPAPALTPIELMERGPLESIRCAAKIGGLPREIAEREIGILRGRAAGMNPQPEFAVEELLCAGAGNAVVITAGTSSVKEVLSSIGEIRIPAERVANSAWDQLNRLLKSGAPVGEYLADQLLLPMAVAGSGAFRTYSLTEHTTTNIDTIRRFLKLPIEARGDGSGLVTVRVGGQ